MIQDTSTSPEMFAASLPSGQLAGWGIAEEYEGDEDSLGDGDYSTYEERSSLWGISVPGEADWVAQVSPALTGVPYRLLTPRSR